LSELLVILLPVERKRPDLRHLTELEAPPLLPTDGVSCNSYGLASQAFPLRHMRRGCRR